MGEEASASSPVNLRRPEMTDVDIKDVLKRHANKLMTVPGVVGVAEGRTHGKQCISIFVIDSKAESLKLLPNNIEGYSVNIEESGEFRALDS